MGRLQCTTTSYQATTVTSSPLGVQRWRVSKASGGEGFRVSATVNLGGLGLANLLFLVLAQLEVESAQVLFKSLQVGCAWDREEVFALSKNPGKRELAGRAAFALGNLADAVDKLQVLGEVLLGEARCEFAEVAWVDGSANHAQLQQPLIVIYLPS